MGNAVLRFTQPIVGKIQVAVLLSVTGRNDCRSFRKIIEVYSSFKWVRLERIYWLYRHRTPSSMKMGLQQWSIYPEEEFKITVFFEGENLSTASTMVTNLQPVGKCGCMEHPTIDSQKVLSDQHRFEPSQKVKHKGQLDSYIVCVALPCQFRILSNLTVKPRSLTSCGWFCIISGANLDKAPHNITWVLHYQIQPIASKPFQGFPLPGCLHLNKWLCHPQLTVDPSILSNSFAVTRKRKEEKRKRNGYPIADIKL